MSTLSQIIVLAYCYLRNDFACLKAKYIDCADIVELLNTRYAFSDDKPCNKKNFNEALGDSQKMNEFIGMLPMVLNGCADFGSLGRFAGSSCYR